MKDNKESPIPNFCHAGLINRFLKDFGPAVCPGPFLGPGVPGAGVPEKSGRIPKDFPPLAEGSQECPGELLGASQGIPGSRETGAGFLSKLYILTPDQPPLRPLC